jgi:hypothetical protein
MRFCENPGPMLHYMGAVLLIELRPCDVLSCALPNGGCSDQSKIRILHTAFNYTRLRGNSVRRSLHSHGNSICAPNVEISAFRCSQISGIQRNSRRPHSYISRVLYHNINQSVFFRLNGRHEKVAVSIFRHLTSITNVGGFKTFSARRSWTQDPVFK